MDAVDVWSASGGGDPLSAWTAPRFLRRAFDAGVKGYVAELPAGGPPRPSLPGARDLARSSGGSRLPGGRPSQAPKPLYGGR